MIKKYRVVETLKSGLIDARGIWIASLDWTVQAGDGHGHWYAVCCCQAKADADQIVADLAELQEMKGRLRLEAVPA